VSEDLASKRAFRALVCGTNYGASYVKAVLRSDGRFALAGLLTRGSERSCHLATKLDVPLYTDADEVPDDIDIACVAVPPPAGAHIAVRLLRRGIHVIREQPISPVEVKGCLGAARSGGSLFYVNAHWGELPAGTEFIRACALTRQHEAPLCIWAVANRRAMFHLVDILGRALGKLAPTELEAVSPAEIREAAAFTVLQGTLGGVPLTMLVQSFLGEVDDGKSDLAGFQATMTFRGGHVSLVEAFGPVVTSGWPGHFEPQRPAWSINSQTPVSGRDTGDLRIAANLVTLHSLADAVVTGKSPFEQQEAHLMATAEVGKLCYELLGSPRFVVTVPG